MNKKEIDAAWFKAHPILWFVCLACIVIASATVIADIRMFANGIAPEVGKYVVAVICSGGLVLGNALRRKRGNEKAEPTGPRDDVPASRDP